MVLKDRLAYLSLDLAFFDIETIGQETLVGIGSLSKLLLNSNRIIRVHPDAFNDC